VDLGVRLLGTCGRQGTGRLTLATPLLQRATRSSLRYQGTRGPGVPASTDAAAAREGRTPMDNVDTWVWVLIAVVALLLLLGLIWALTKGRKAKEQHRLEKEREHREEANRLREEAREATVSA